MVGSVLVAHERPVAVSPGSAEGTMISARCPSFDWGKVDGADSYELVVYRVSEVEAADADDSVAVIRVTLPGSAAGWTPSLDRCLEPGRYAWSLRALHQKGPGDWSRPSLFRVATAVSEEQFREALAVVKSYLATADPGASEVARLGESAPAAPGAPDEPAPTPALTRAPGQGSGGVTIGSEGIFLESIEVKTHAKIVFVTSLTYTGNLGGLEGADTKCLALAVGARLSGEFKAWLSADSCGPDDVSNCRGFTQSAGPYCKVDDTVVAQNFADLTDGNLLSAIDLDETGLAMVPAGEAVWTNTDAFGSSLLANPCNGWKIEDPGFSAPKGSAGSVLSTWTFSGAENCDNTNRLYCVEQ